MNQEAFVNHFSKYVPARAAELFYEWTEGEGIHYRITRPRNSKLGDFRAPHRGTPARISVNGNLNPYSFMITFTHEFAHYLDFMERKSLKLPHGEPWKAIYTSLLQQLLRESLFPDNLKAALARHIRNPKAASCSDPTLNAALRQYDEAPLPFLKDLSENSLFRLTNGRVFRKGPLRRTRYRCQEVHSGRWYLVHGHAEVASVHSTAATGTGDSGSAG